MGAAGFVKSAIQAQPPHHSVNWTVTVVYPRGGGVMYAKRLRDKAALWLRLANSLSANNPARTILMDMAAKFEGRAKELETQRPVQQQQQPQPDDDKTT